MLDNTLRIKCSIFIYIPPRTMAFRTSTLSKGDALSQLASMRSRSGNIRPGRRSKYAGISERAALLTDDTVLRVVIPKKQVQPLKAYLMKHHGRIFTVKTAPKSGEDVTAFIFRQDLPPKRSYAKRS